MLFENIQVETHQLPDIKQISWTPLEPIYRRYSIIANLSIFGSLIIIILGVGFTNTFFDGWRWPLIFSGLLLAWLLVALLFSVMGYRHKAYAIRQRDVLYRSGWIWRKSTILPFNRVQHCEVSQGPIERFFGLATLQIFTAGGSSSDMHIPGLLPDTAHSIKDYIIHHTGKIKDDSEE